MVEPTLRLAEIRKSFNKGAPNEISVLRSVDLALQPGETAALLAPSGAGKSTLLHIAGILDSPDYGTITIGGKRITHESDRIKTRTRRLHVGFVYQFHHLFQEFTARENVMLPQLVCGISRSRARRRAMELLDRVGVSHRADHRPADMSGGEQQRVAICRALANEPLLLLADEPTGNLDPETSDQVFDLMMSVVRETGLTALIATHNLDLARRLDTELKLVDGEIA